MGHSNYSTGINPLGIAALLVLVISGPLWQCGSSDEGGDRVSYWLWAGLTAKDAPPDSELYVYQGLFKSDDTTSVFERRGLFPHPIECRSLYLVYRLEGALPGSKAVLDEFENNVARWQRHSLVVTGIQLDFDSPTAKLDTYVEFLSEFRGHLGRQFELSVTGLGDWVMSGDQRALKAIATTVDEIVFQLYQGQLPLTDIDDYLYKLSSYPLPFRIGLISGHEPPESAATLRDNPNFKGIIYFVRRGA